MKCKYLSLFFGFFLLCLFGLIPLDANAASVSGYNTYYIQQTSNGTLPNNYSSTVSGLSFPTTSYTQLGAYQNQTYNVIRAMDLQFPNIEFVNGNTYTFTINFDYGSYIYPSWPNTANISTAFGIRSCPYGTCTATMTWQNDSSHQSVNTLQLKLVHKANANQTGKTFGIGPMTGNNGLFYNAYSSQQGIRINSATVDIVEDPNYQNTQDIINNQNQNTQTIINNQNENTEKEIESQQVCKNVEITINYENKDDYNVGFLNPDNTINNVSTWRYTNYIELTKDNEYTLRGTGAIGNASYCFYNLDKTLISCTKYNETSLPVTFTPSSDMLFRFSGYVNTDYYITLFSGTICKNGNQALSDDINDLNNTLKDDSLDDFPSGGGGGTYFDDINQSSQTPISDLLLLPLNLLNAINNSINNQCTPYTFPFDFTGGNNTLTFPCLNLQNYLGSNLWGVIDALFCIFMIYNIAMLIIRFFEDWTSARDTFDILFKPEGGGF